MNLYPEMNKKIVNILRLTEDNPMNLYAAQLIEEQAAKLTAFDNAGATPEQVQEWAKAEQDGRLVVIPCKIGDTVYIVDEDDEEPREMGIDNIRITDDGIWLRSDPWDGVICEVSALEHWIEGCYPVFYSLSREAAEAAMKGAPPV